MHIGPSDYSSVVLADSSQGSAGNFRGGGVKKSSRRSILVNGHLFSRDMLTPWRSLYRPATIRTRSSESHDGPSAGLDILHEPAPISAGTISHARYAPDIIRRVSNRPALKVNKLHHRISSKSLDLDASSRQESCICSTPLIPDSLVSVLSSYNHRTTAEPTDPDISRPDTTPKKTHSRALEDAENSSSRQKDGGMAVWLLAPRASSSKCASTTAAEDFSDRSPPGSITSNSVTIQAENVGMSPQLTSIAVPQLIQRCDEGAASDCDLDEVRYCSNEHSEILPAIVADDDSLLLSIEARSMCLDRQGSSSSLDWRNTVTDPGSTSNPRSDLGSGYDGPLSPVGTWSECRATDSQTQNNGLMACPDDRKLQCGSKASGSIDWEKSWYKHKPRRAHNVSEVTAPDPVFHKHAVDIFSMTSFDGDESDEDIITARSSIVRNHLQSSVIQVHAFKSCPELYRPLESPSGQTDQTVNYLLTTGQKLRLTRKQTVPDSEGRVCHPIRDTIRERLRHLRRKLHRSSSNYSIRSEFPAPLHGTERRLLSRDSADIYPSSGEETPVFTTPLHGTPTMTPSGSGNLAFEPSSNMQIQQVERPDHGTPFNTTMMPVDPSILSQTTSNTPKVSAFQPVSVFSTKPGHRRRAATRSRLSEVTTPEEFVAFTPEASPCSYQPYATHDYDESAIEDGDMEDLSHQYPPPLTISRQNGDDIPRGLRLASSRAQQVQISLTPWEKAECLMKDGSGLGLKDGVDPIVEGEEVPPRISAVERAPEPHSVNKMITRSAQPTDTKACNINADQPNNILGPLLVLATDAPQVKPSPMHPKIRNRSNERNKLDMNSQRLLQPSRDRNGPGVQPESCHPDTWGISQAESGDSDPFCPPECVPKQSSA